MPNRTIPDKKKAAIVALSSKYGSNSLSNKLDVSINTVKKYRRLAEEDGFIEMDGTNLETI